MSIYRFFANKDATISDAYKVGNLTSSRLSNTGKADSLEVYSIFGRQDSGSLEKSRFLIEFPTTQIATKRSNNVIPASGSVDFYLNLYNIEHNMTLPEDFKLVVAPISRSWAEGYGVDLDNYTDPGYGDDGIGVNWIYANSASSGFISWSSAGGDYLSSPRYEQTFEEGTEDLSINITPLVEDWLAGNIDNNGVGVFLTSSQENSRTDISYFTKRFSARGSEFFFNRPNIEARWNSSVKDSRGNFFVSSSRVPASQNLNDIYFYNYFRGDLIDLPVSASNITVKLYSDLESNELSNYGPQPLTPTKVDTGTYKLSVYANTTASHFYDVWTSGSETYFTGTIKADKRNWNNISQPNEYTFNVSNNNFVYNKGDNPRFRVYSRQKRWLANAVNKFSPQSSLNIVDDVYYKVVRVVDDLEVIPYGTGSLNSTLLSYDLSGSYFDLDTSFLEEGFTYGIKLLYDVNGKKKEVDEIWKFKVEK